MWPTTKLITSDNRDTTEWALDEKTSHNPEVKKQEKTSKLLIVFEAFRYFLNIASERGGGMSRFFKYIF